MVPSCLNLRLPWLPDLCVTVILHATELGGDTAQETKLCCWSQTPALSDSLMSRSLALGLVLGATFLPAFDFHGSQWPSPADVPLQISASVVDLFFLLLLAVIYGVRFSAFSPV